jgi:TPR repeat protein
VRRDLPRVGGGGDGGSIELHAGGVGRTDGDARGRSEGWVFGSRGRAARGEQQGHGEERERTHGGRHGDRLARVGGCTRGRRVATHRPGDFGEQGGSGYDARSAVGTSTEGGEQVILRHTPDNRTELGQVGARRSTSRGVLHALLRLGLVAAVAVGAGGSLGCRSSKPVAAPALKEPVGVQRCGATDAAQCAERCGRGESQSCNDLALMFYEGREVSQDWERASFYFKEACDKNHGAGCFNLATVYASGSGVTKDPSFAAEIFEKGCDLLNAPSCFALAEARMKGEGMERDAPRAAVLFRKACEHGLPRGCTRVGDLMAEGEGVDLDRKGALGFYERACNGGEVDTCYELGQKHEKGSLGDADGTLAARFYERACDGGSAKGCAEGAVLLDRGLSTPRDATRAVKLYERACDAGHGRSCYDMGALSYLGEGVAADKSRAASFFGKACEAGEAPGCFQLARMTFQGDGIAADAKAAALTFEKACPKGSTSCFNPDLPFEAATLVPPAQSAASKAPAVKGPAPAAPAGKGAVKAEVAAKKAKKDKKGAGAGKRSPLFAYDATCEAQPDLRVADIVKESHELDFTLKRLGATLYARSKLSRKVGDSLGARRAQLEAAEAAWSERRAAVLAVDLASERREAEQLRKDAVAALRYYLDDNTTVARQLDEITQGAGFEDLIDDLGKIASIVDAYASALAKADLPPNAGRRLLELAGHLRGTSLELGVDPVSAEALALRNRSFWWLSDAMDEVGSAGQYIYRNEPALLVGFRTGARARACVVGRAPSEGASPTKGKAKKRRRSDLLSDSADKDKSKEPGKDDKGP